MIIDAHSRVHDPVEAHVGLLDEAGVDRAVLFATRPHPERAGDLTSLRREMAILDEAIGGRASTAEGYRGAWRELDAALAARPDRFIGFLSVPLDLEPDRIAATVEREVIGRGLRGIGELSASGDEPRHLKRPVTSRRHPDRPRTVTPVHPSTPACDRQRPELRILR
ncbi:hypothetical protein [Streptomyces sp. NPDC094472]|uniref:hypothetical protein n=1 Tax=unclassified Streptomyces TaxID=2593676 RepID=UPI0033346ADF